MFPRTCAPSIRAAFGDWNRMLADSLGIPIASPKDDPEPAIELLVAQAWWQDDLWDGVVDGEP